MTNLKFSFKFNEAAEPVSELNRYRAALSKKYKTQKELVDYCRSVLGDEFLEEKPGVRSKTKANRKTSRKPLQEA